VFEDATLAATTVPLYPGFVGVSVAERPDGWVVAGYAAPELFIHAVDSAGRDLGRTTVENVSPDIIWGGMPTLAARPGGGPLLVWKGVNGLRAAVVASDGRSTTAPRDLPVVDPTTPPTLFTAAYVGDAFYVATPTDSLTNASQLRLQRVETDGTPTTSVDALPGVEAWSPSLVTGAADLRVVYFSQPTGPSPDGYGVVWQKLGLAGDATSPAILLGGPDDYVGSAVALGDDTVAAVAGGTTLQIAHVDGQGNVVTPLYPIVTATDSYPDWYAIVRRGSDVVVAWKPDLRGSVGIARVAP
jgi:hypothetical protein